eukprot:EG_transcript_12552
MFGNAITHAAPYHPPVETLRWLWDHLVRLHSAHSAHATKDETRERRVAGLRSELMMKRTVIQTLAHSAVQSRLYEAEGQAVLNDLRREMDALRGALREAFARFIGGTTAATLGTFQGILNSDFRREVWATLVTLCNAGLSFNASAMQYVCTGQGTVAEMIYCYAWIAAHLPPILELFIQWPDDKTPNEIRYEHIFQGEALLKEGGLHTFQEWIADFSTIQEVDGLRPFFEEYALKFQQWRSHLSAIAFHRLQVAEHDSLKVVLEAQSRVATTALARLAGPPDPTTQLLHRGVLEAAGSVNRLMYYRARSLRCPRPGPPPEYCDATRDSAALGLCHSQALAALAREPPPTPPAAVAVALALPLAPAALHGGVPNLGEAYVADLSSAPFTGVHVTRAAVLTHTAAVPLVARLCHRPDPHTAAAPPRVTLVQCAALPWAGPVRLTRAGDAWLATPAAAP